MESVNVGDFVIWHDSKGRPHNALVTTVWSQTCINLVIVSGDDEKQDQYGRQIERYTSQPYKSLNSVHGNYWRFYGDEPNPYQAPTAV